MQFSDYQLLRFFRNGLIVLFIGLARPQLVLAQVPLKSDYVVLGDTALSQGKIAGLPTEGNTVVTFVRSKRTGPVRYTVNEATEFQLSDRQFFSKEIQIENAKRRVFLERLPNFTPEVTIWKFNGRQAVFYLETEKGIEPMEEAYRDQLDQAYGNPDLQPLLEITSLSEFQINYLSKTAKNLNRPRTFTRLFTLTPWAGYSLQKLGLLIPDTNIGIDLQGPSPTFGLDGEAFLTFRRNLSLVVGLAWSQLDAQHYVDYTFNQIRYQSDVFVDLSRVEVPVRGRYYYDLKPNSMRVYAEAGYVFSMVSYDRLGVFQAEFERNTITTSTKTFELSDSFNGFTWGVGFEKYLSKHRGVVLGIRQASLTGDFGNSVRGFDVHFGFKF